MLYYLIEHSGFIFLFFAVPILGWTLQRFVERKLIIYASLVFAVFLSPIFSGYSYIFDNAYGYLIFMLATCCYALLIIKEEPKISFSLIFSGILFLVCGFLCMLGAMVGTITIENSWNFKNYKIEYVRDQGFSGGPLMTYRLNKYGVIPIFIKEVDVRVDNDTTKSCLVHFEESKFNFNKCENDSSYFDKR